ncbi:MAG: substrate-binding domain-containing protein [Atopobiaceae bacterium]|jgi:putative amino-acid transport system substrate-binding protein
MKEMGSLSRRNFLKGAFAVSALAGSSVLLAGCSGGSAASSSNSSDSQDGSSDAITKVTIVTGGTGEPYSLIGTDGSWTGIDADIWAKIKENTGVDYEVKQAEFSSMFGELDAGRANVVANCLAVKKERTDKYLASHPYYGDAQCVVVGKDNTDINTFEDLAGKNCGVANGQASQTIAEEMSSKYGFTITTYDDSNAGLSNLALGRIDAMFTTDTAVYKWEDANNDEVRFLDERTMANNVAYFFAKTDEGQKYCDFVNEQIDKMLADGSMAEIVTKWLHNDMTQSIIEE